MNECKSFCGVQCLYCGTDHKQINTWPQRTEDWFDCETVAGRRRQLRSPSYMSPRMHLCRRSKKNVATYIPDDLCMCFFCEQISGCIQDTFGSQTPEGFVNKGRNFFVLIKAETFFCNYCCDSLLSPLTGSLAPQPLSPRSSDADALTLPEMTSSLLSLSPCLSVCESSGCTHAAQFGLPVVFFAEI